MDVQKIISEMTLQEKIAFCTGADFWCTKAIPEHGVPETMMSDGPHGLRCPLRAAVINSGGTMNDSLAKGLLQMANGHYLKGIAAMLGK